MKKVVLMFPDAAILADFLWQYKIIDAEICVIESAITAFLPDDIITTACARYGALVRRISYAA